MQAVLDQNWISSMLWVSSVDWITPIPLRVNPVTGCVLIEIVWWGWWGVTTTLWDLIYWWVTWVETRLAWNTTTTLKFLSQVWDWTNSAAPTWQQIPAQWWTIWSLITTNQSISSWDYWYFANWAGMITLTLPVTSALWDRIRVSAHNAFGWHIAQNAWQTIYAWNTLSTAGISGYLESTWIGDAIELICVVANTIWRSVGMEWIITII